jgi:2-alkyl-3-oxoalkanoate reductase
VTAVVTGAAGFLGRAVVEALRAQGRSVLGLDLRPSPTTDVVGDLLVDGPWQDDLAHAETVVHTAALVGERGDPERFWAANVEITRRVLDAAVDAHVVHLSAIVVHGSSFPDGVTEDAPVQPTGNPYTDTKIASEHLALLSAARGRSVTVVRPGDVYGPGSEQWTLRPVAMLRAGRLAAPSTGVLSPVFVDDVVRGIVLATTSEAAVGQVVHLAGARGVPVAEFFGRYAQLLGRRLPVLPTALVRAAAGPLGLLGERAPLSRRTLEYVTHPGTYSVAKAERLLGWRPDVDLDEGMRRTATWLRDERLLG